MKKFRFTAVISVLLFSGLAHSGPNLDVAADDLCECLVEPYKQLSRVSGTFKQAQASGDLSQLTAAQGEMMEVMNSSRPCFEGLSKKYPEIEKSDPLKKQVMQIAEKKCPSPIPLVPANR